MGLTLISSKGSLKYEICSIDDRFIWNLGCHHFRQLPSVREQADRYIFSRLLLSQLPIATLTKSSRQCALPCLLHVQPYTTAIKDRAARRGIPLVVSRKASRSLSTLMNLTW